jgi:alpha-L-rhamnosidase
MNCGGGRWFGGVIAVVIVTVGLAACSSGSDAGPPAPSSLTVDGMTAPIGLSPSDVQFGWQLGDTRRGAVQNAYRIVVTKAGAKAKAATVWDSGKVLSNQQAFVGYDGAALASDTAYQWTVQTWAASGGASKLANTGKFETGLTDADWKASWIRRPEDTQTRPDQYAYARKDVTLTASPVVRARAYVSGDQQYELYINGKPAGKGQAYSYPDTQYYETLDVTSLLHAGAANAIGALYMWDPATKGHPEGAPGVIVQLSIDHADGTHEIVATDGSWRVHQGAWLPGKQRDLEGDIVDWTENIDGRKFPIGWDRPGFDDKGWAAATVVGPAGTAPWTNLVSVRTHIVEEPVQPVSVKTLASGSVVVDFGKVYAAVPTVTFHHGKSGRTINMHAGYLLDPDGSVSTTHGTQHTDMSYSYIERGHGTEQFLPFDYLGFRYFQIDAPGEKLSKSDVVALTRHAVVPDEHAASFSSSNSTIDDEFELGVHSSLFTAQESFIDTPTREKGPWLWDGYNESITAIAVFGEENLTRKSLIEFAASQKRYWPNGSVNKIYPTGLGALDINEFTEIYPEWVWQYWIRTGDRSLLEAVYPALQGVANYVQASVSKSTGLVTNLPATSIYYDFPVVTRINNLGVNVFRRAGDIAATLSRPQSEIDLQRARQGALTAAINKHLIRPDGTYVDGAKTDGTQVEAASQDANSSAIVYGVAPDAKVPHIASYIASLGLTAVPRTAGEVLEALALAGRDDAIEKILTNKKADGWANILARGATFTWEVWNPSDIIGDSMSHGWGANVALEIQMALLGVRPTAPGLSTFSVTPPLHALKFANGAVPTPSGPIAVSWRRGDSSGHGFTLSVTVPVNASAELRIPAKSEASVTESGRPIARADGVHFVKVDGAYVVVDVGAGSYDFKVS